jgi:hypothetical protein
MLTFEEIKRLLLDQATALDKEADRAADRATCARDMAYAVALRFVAEAVFFWTVADTVPPEEFLGEVRDFALGATRAARSYPKNEILEGRQCGAWRAVFCLEKAAGMGTPYRPAPEEVAPAPEQFDAAPAREDRGARCQGMTRAGTYCRNVVLPGERFCWRHIGGAA